MFSNYLSVQFVFDGLLDLVGKVEGSLNCVNRGFSSISKSEWTTVFPSSSTILKSVFVLSSVFFFLVAGLVTPEVLTTEVDTSEVLNFSGLATFVALYFLYVSSSLSSFHLDTKAFEP